MKPVFKLILMILLCMAAPAKQANAEPKKAKTFSINFENTDLRSALEMLATHSGLRLSASSEITGNVSYSFSNVTLEGALKQIARENGLAFKITDNGMLSVSKAFSVTSSSGNGRSPASETDPVNSRHIKLKYITVGEANEIVNPMLGKDDKLIKDQPSNSLVFVGSDQAFAGILQTLSSFDVMPQQILIEANIVEINKNKSREFGFSYGDMADPGVTNVVKNKAGITNHLTGSPNFALQLGLGQIDGATLSARLAAAEVEGAAKILSRPKVVTINNKAANINSGITYSVRTVAAVSGGGSGSGGGGSVSGGIASVSAGLTLSVTPTVVGDNQVKLAINVNNSEPDLSSAIDGIPGVVTNATQTEIIVENGKTASVAGLVKNSFAESETGVPFLRKIPVLGWLFSSSDKQNRDKELMVFITPKIVERTNKELDKDMKEVEKRFPEVVFDGSKKSSAKQERLPASKN